MYTDFVCDMHTHTIVSGHAYNTMNEMIRAAADKGLKLYGITEHAPGMLGSTNKFYFQNLNILSREKYGIQVRYGVELNIMDYDGGVDLEPRDVRDLDYCIASLHYNCIAPGSCAENTRTYLKAMDFPKVRIIGHPDDGRFPVDYNVLVKEAADRRILLEINNSSLNPLGFREHVRDNIKTILTMSADRDLPVILSSDAHREEDVGNFTQIVKILEEVHFPERLIVNRSPELVEEYL